MIDSPKRILIVRLGGIGDIVCTLPALEALRAGLPNAFIGYAVEEPAYDLVNRHPALDHIHLFPRRSIFTDLKNPARWPVVVAKIRRYRRELRSAHYDVALDFQRNLKGAAHTLMSGAPRRIGFTAPTAQEFNNLFYREHVDPAPATHWVDKFLAMAKAIGGKPDAARYRLPDAPASRERVEAFLAQNHLTRFIAMHPGASAFDPARRWEPNRFGELARRIGSHKKITTVVTWGPGERELAERVVQASDRHAMLSFETRSLLDLSELYRTARAYVGSDTGPMHIATAVGLPSVVLFGSGNPAAYGPRSPASRIVSKMQNEKLRPMSEITVEDVFRATIEILRME